MKKRYVLLFLTMLAFIAGESQIQINVMLQPPYSPYFSDYLTYENKAVVTFVNPGPSIDVFLAGSVTGDQTTPVKLTTKAGFKGTSPLTIATGTTTINGFDIAPYFDWNNIDISGVSVAEVLQNNGLPEGNYTVCIVAYDWNNPTRQVSNFGSGCFQFPVVQVEPPVVVFPACGGKVFASPAQTFMFTWSPSPGAPATTRYILSMALMVNPDGDPNDALNTLSTPPFFEKELNTFAYVYQMSDPKLIAGATYAWRITAFDPDPNFPNRSRTAFRNNGMSQACKFSYINAGAGDALLLPDDQRLLITSPECKNPKLDSISIDKNNDALFNWVWAEQVYDTLYFKHPEQVRFNGKGIWKYEVTFKKTNAKKALKELSDLPFKPGTSFVYAPSQKFSLSLDNWKSQGFKYGQSYKVNIIVYDSFGLPVLTKESCDFVFTEGEKASTLPEVEIKGKLVYQFKDENQIYPANNTTFTLQMRSDSNQISGQKIKKTGWSGSGGGISSEFPFVSVKTDDQGNFKCKLPITAADTATRYIKLLMNSPYYGLTKMNFAVGMSYTGYDSVNKKYYNYGQRNNLDLGEIKSTVYDYTLTVDLKKGYPQFFYDTLTKGLKNNGSVTIDTMTINAKSQVKAGITVELYRKSKKSYVPYHELGKKVTEFEDKGTLVKIAEAKTYQEKIGSKNFTRVKFKLLVCNLSSGDQYYIKAILPEDAAKSKGGGKDKYQVSKNVFDYSGNKSAKEEEIPEELTATLQEVIFDKKIFASNTFHYEQSISYFLVSKTPPLTKLTGKLVYHWPSQPEIIRPLSNAKFKITIRYYLNGEPFIPKMGGDACHHELYELTAGDPNKDGYYDDAENVPTAEDGMTVGTGTTDAEGNFTLYVINHNTKGNISTDAHWNLKGTINTCEQKTKKENPMDKKKGYPDDDWSFGMDKWGKWDDGMAWGENSVLDFGMNGFTGATKGFGNVKGSMNNMMNGAAGQNFGAGAAKGNLKAGMKGVSGPYPDLETSELNDPPISVDRRFSLELESPWSTYYYQPGYQGKLKSNSFTAQAFENKDLGTFTTLVDEVEGTERSIKVDVYGSDKKLKSGYQLYGAKLVIFRLPDAKTPGKPLGEGSDNHPMKNLLVANFSGFGGVNNTTSQNINQKMEWVLDYPIEIGSNNTFLLSSTPAGLKKILDNGGEYYVQISPDPQSGGKTFQPVIASFGTENISVYLLPSRIAGRAIDETSGRGLKNAKITLTVGSKVYETSTIDTSGYFEAINGVTKFGWINWINWKASDWISMQAKSEGYKVSNKPTNKIDVEGTQWFEVLKMKPSGNLVGKVVDENDKPIDAYVMRDDSTIYETWNWIWKGYFSMPITGNKKHNISIIPKDVGYFDTVIKNIFVPDGKKDLGKIVVYRRKHRMYFDLKLVDKSGNPVPQGIMGIPAKKFKLTINNDEKLVSYNGVGGIYIEFENVSVNQYSVLIEDVKGGSYIPKQINVKNSETRETVVIPVTLKQGETISGKVLMGELAVKNARVYVNQNGMAKYNGGAAYSEMETRTDASGNFEIKGVPSTGNVMLYATLDTTFTVSGASKKIDMAGNTTGIELTLTAVKGVLIKSVFGFPLSVEKIQEVGGKFRVTGLVDLGKNQSDFEWLDPNTKMRIKDIVFVKNAFGVGTPEDDEVAFTEVVSLKMRYLKKYNVNLTKDPVPADGIPKSSTPLSIVKDPAGGSVNSKATIVDNSFNFPSSYLSFEKTGPFYLAVITNGVASTTVKSIYNATGIVAKPKYNLSNSMGKALEFRFINFKTLADPTGSYIGSNGAIHLKAIMTGYIPNGQGNINVEIPDLVLDNNEVKPAAGVAPLLFSLQNWKVEVKDWSVDPKEGGLISHNCLIKTGIVDVPVKTFNLRSDLFVIKDFQLTSLKLGGGALTLEQVSSNALLVFDEKCGSDLGKHWRLAINSIGSKPAAIVPASTPLGKELRLSYIQLISFGNENILSMEDIPGGVKNLYGNNKLTFFPKTLGSGADYFWVGGVLDINVPRILSVPCNLTMKKAGGALTMDMEALDIQFEGKGYVKFKSDLTKIPEHINKTTTIFGTIAEPGKMNPIPCKLTFGNFENGRIYLNKAYRLNLTSDGNSPSGLGLILSDNVDLNGCRVVSGDWNLLKFSGQLDDPQSKEMTVGKPKPVMNFEVFGEIKANSNSIEVSEISTPFGDASFTFDFPSKELRGALEIPDGTQFGTWTMGGQLETRFSPSGFIICGAAQVNTGTLLVDGFGTFSMGFLLGNYTLDDGLILKATTYSKDPKSQCWLQANKNGFKGFYFVGGYDVLNVKEGFDIVVASVYLHAVLGVEAALGANFKNSSYTLRVGAHGKVEAGMGAITGTSISGSVEAHVTASANYKNGFRVKGEANATVAFDVCQSYVVDEVCWGESVAAGINFGFGQGQKAYFDFFLGDPGELKGCKADD